MTRVGLPFEREGDDRYWRSRANRRVRKRRLTRTALRWSAFGLAHLLIGGMVLFAGVRVFMRITSAEEFSVQRIEITGARRTSSDAIRHRLAPQLGRNLLDLNLHEVVSVATSDPWVEHASAKRVLPATVRLEIRERTPRAVALVGGVAHLIDATGFVIQPCGPGAGDDLPVLVGLDRLEGEALLAGLRRGAQLLIRLERQAPGFAHEISEVDLSADDRVTLRTVDPGPTILLDPLRVERNVSDYLELRRDIRRRLGTLEYVDLRWRNRISVMPRKQTPSTEDS